MVMKKIIRSALSLAIISLLMFGVLIPTAEAAISENIYGPANGSQININGTIYGSYLLEQAFNRSFFFQGRPSAINFNSTESGSPECSPNTNQSLNLTIENLKKFESENRNVNISNIPGELIMDSGSGLDPDIPVQGACIQVYRIAFSLQKLSKNSSVNISTEKIVEFLRTEINETKKQDFPFFGAYYVNVVRLNVQIIYFMIQNKIITYNSIF